METLQNKQPTIQRFSGFADVYDRYRPSPPEILADILSGYTKTVYPDLVIDIGCGTGLSTRYWIKRARLVIGVDPSQDMLRQALIHTNPGGIAYLLGYAHETGLMSSHADLVTCSQALHWMEPEPTLAEAARLLRLGGVFAAYDHDGFPLTGSWEVDRANREFHTKVGELEEKFKTNKGVKRWAKSGHLDRMQASGHFRFTRQIDLHQVIMGNAAYMIGGVLSYGAVQSLLKSGISEKELGLDLLRETAERELGYTLKPWYWSTRLLIGVK